jgi:heat shock protein HtpX
MPEVGIYESPEVNAFATGPSRNNSLVAVSSGLLRGMNRDEVEGVLGHEIAHIANGDMVTMTLVQGVINAFVIFFAKAAAWAIANFMRGNNDEGPSFMVAFGIEMVLHIIFGFVGMIIVAWFSRYREFRADQGGAKLAGTGKMVAALERLKSTTDLVDNRQESIAAFKISGKGGFMALFSTHPPLEQRIARLKGYSL